MSPTRSKRSRRRRLFLRLILPVVVVVAAALVVYLAVSTRSVVPGLSASLHPIHYRETISSVAERYDLDPYLVAAVVRAESDYDPDAVSHAGAVGLMQLMPATAKWITGLDEWRGPDEPELTDPEDSLELGSCYLAFLLHRFSGDERAALASYNAGQGAVDSWMSESDPDAELALADIPFEETREFVERVEHFREVYVRVHPDAFGQGARET